MVIGIRSEQPRRPLPQRASGKGVGGLGFLTHIFKLDAAYNLV